MAGERKYPDLKYLFMRGLIHHEGDQRRHHYLKSAAECTSRAIVSLELADEPIKSVKQARRLEGIGGETCSRLSKIDKEKEFSCLKPLVGRFVSSAGGILVALLDATEELIHNGKSADKALLVPEDSVQRRAARLTEELFAEGPNEFCKAWWRVEVLIKRGYIRRRSQKKAAVLQLLPIGKDIASKLRSHAGLTSTVPIVPSLSYKLPAIPKSLQMASSVSRERTASCSASVSGLLSESNLYKEEIFPQQPELADALYTNDQGLDGIVMLVDRRELGGERVFLGELCRLLGDNGICYKTQHLKAGDYSWVWHVKGEEIVLPCLVERKRADDIARTLKENRFWSQVNRMKSWKEEFSQRGVECAVHYILEGKPEQYVVKCEDGCQGIIQCGNPTLQQVKLVIEDLKRHPDLLVKETDDLNITVILLTSLTAELKERAKKGDFDNLLQAALSDEKPSLGNLDTSSSLNGPAHELDRVTSLGQDVKTEPVAMDLAFDEELKTVLERSKLEVSMAHEVLNGMPDTGSKFPTETEVRNSTLVEDEDAELAAVLERSKYETRGRGDSLAAMRRGDNFLTPSRGVSLSTLGRRGDFTETRTEPIPIMQYHCTEGGSLHYPTTSGKTRTNIPNTYRPKINKKPVPSSTTIDNIDMQLQQSYDTDYKPSISKMPNSCKSPYFTNKYVSSSHNSLDSDSTYMDLVVNSDFNSNSIEKGFKEEREQTKRKYSKKAFVFEPDVNNLEQTYATSSDDEITSKKKSKRIHFQITPSEEFLEHNVMQVTQARDNPTEERTEVCTNSVSKLGKVFRMRKVDNEKFNVVERETTSVVEKVKETKDGTGLTNDDDESDGYDSSEDLFGDDSVLSPSKKPKTNVETSSSMFDTSWENSDKSINKSKKGRFTDDNFDEDYDWRYRREIDGTAGAETLELDVSGLGNFEKENRDTDISFSQNSDSGESLPDIGLDIITKKKSSGRDLGSSKESENGLVDLELVSRSSIGGKDLVGRERRFDSGYDSDARAGVSDSDIENKVKLVLSVLPHVDKNVVRELLKKCNKNVDVCVSELLEG